MLYIPNSFYLVWRTGSTRLIHTAYSLKNFQRKRDQNLLFAFWWACHVLSKLIWLYCFLSWECLYHQTPFFAWDSLRCSNIILLWNVINIIHKTVNTEILYINVHTYRRDWYIYTKCCKENIDGIYMYVFVYICVLVLAQCCQIYIKHESMFAQMSTTNVSTVTLMTLT